MAAGYPDERPCGMCAWCTMTELHYWTVLIAIPVYIVLQLVAIARLRGALRMMSLGIAVFMAAVLGLTIDAYVGRSNVWLIFLVLAGPPAVALTTALLGIGYVVGAGVDGDRRQRKQAYTTAS